MVATGCVISVFISDNKKTRQVQNVTGFYSNFWIIEYTPQNTPCLLVYVNGFY